MGDYRNLLALLASTGSDVPMSWAGFFGSATFFVFLGVVARQIVPWKRQETISEAQFRTDLIRRITWLERREVRHDAEKRLLIHKLRNVTANFDSMLMMLEMNPNRVPEIVAAIKKQRAAQMIAEAQEAAIITRAAEEDVGVELEGLTGVDPPIATPMTTGK